MTQRSAWGWRIAVVPFAFAAIAGALLGHPARILFQVCKPLASLLILAGAWYVATPVSRRYQLWVAFGLLLCLAGDVLLLPPWDAFVPGLACFLLAHLMFFAAFGEGVQRPAWMPAMLASFVAGVLVMAWLWTDLPDPLRIPVVVYTAVISLMAGQAIGRAWRLRGRGEHSVTAAYAAFGALVFVLSDTLLAYDRFHAPLPLAALWILGSYYVAIACIARSVHLSGRDVDGAGTEP